jgi:hypothetical protein
MSDNEWEQQVAESEAVRQGACARLHPDDCARRERVIDHHVDCLLGEVIGEALGCSERIETWPPTLPTPCRPKKVRGLSR